MVHGVEPSISPVKGCVEREEVNSGEDPGERTRQETLDRWDTSPPEAIGVCDELYAVSHTVIVEHFGVDTKSGVLVRRQSPKSKLME